MAFQIAPLDIPQFTPEQINPFANLLQNSLKNFTDITNAAYLPQNNYQDLQQKIANTLVAQAKAKYAEPEEQANLQDLLSRAFEQRAQGGLLAQQGVGQGITNETLKQSNLADIAQKQAMANFYNMGGRNLGVNGQNLMQFGRQLMMDNPIKPGESPQDYQQRINSLQSAYLGGSDSLPDGSPTPLMSGTAQQLFQNVTGKNAPVSVKNQAANLDALYQDMSNVDLDALKSFTGVGGKARLAAAQLKMAANPNDPSIDPMARRYFSTMNTLIMNMDQMRKAFGTSVVPDYVYSTVGQLTNPNAAIWNDPKQVQQNYNAVLGQVGNLRKLMMRKAQFGVNAQVPADQQAQPQGQMQNAAPQNSSQNVTWVRKNGVLVRQ